MKCPNCHVELGMQLVVRPEAAEAAPPPAPVPAPGGSPLHWFCPVHGKSKIVPAGIGKNSGKPYSAFWACPERGCNEKPPFGFPVPGSPSNLPERAA